MLALAISENAAVIFKPLPNETLLSKSLTNAAWVSIVGVGNK
jgi:hypothetical protein